jgi:hypothetical protein
MGQARSSTMGRMPTFVDEFGSFGWNANASRHFILTAVWFETPALAVDCERVIAALRATRGLPQTFEFHFASISDTERLAFLNAVSVCSFRYVTSTLQKWRGGKWLEGKMWRKRSYFYERVVAPVVASLKEYLLLAEECKGAPLNEPITYDRCTDKIFHQVLRDQFYRPKAPSGRSLVNKIRSRNSANDSLVQLADMVCGSYAHAFSSSDAYIRILNSRKIGEILIS